MRKKAAVFLAIAAYLAALGCNAGVFWMWNHPGTVQMGATALYMATVAYLLWNCRKQPKWLCGLSAVGGLTGFAGILALLTRAGAHDITMIPALLLSSIFVTPLYGLSAVLTDGDHFYAVAAMCGIYLLLIGILGYRRGRRRIDANE